MDEQEWQIVSSSECDSPQHDVDLAPSFFEEGVTVVSPHKVQAGQQDTASPVTAIARNETGSEPESPASDKGQDFTPTQPHLSSAQAAQHEVEVLLTVLGNSSLRLDLFPGKADSAIHQHASQGVHRQGYDAGPAQAHRRKRSLLVLLPMVRPILQWFLPGIAFFLATNALISSEDAVSCSHHGSRRQHGGGAEGAASRGSSMPSASPSRGLLIASVHTCHPVAMSVQQTAVSA